MATAGHEARPARNSRMRMSRDIIVNPPRSFRGDESDRFNDAALLHFRRVTLIINDPPSVGWLQRHHFGRLPAYFPGSMFGGNAQFVAIGANAANV